MFSLASVQWFAYYAVLLCLSFPVIALATDQTTDQTPDLFRRSPATSSPDHSPVQPSQPRSTPDLFRRPPSPAGYPTPSPSTPNSPPSIPVPSVPELERLIHEQVNQHRIGRGLSPLLLNPEISAIARQHSQDMATKRVPFGHTGLQQRLYRVDRILPTRRVAENAAYIFTHKDTANRAFQGWLRSSSHRQAIEESYYRYTGIGVAQDSNGAFYFTQLYVRPR